MPSGRFGERLGRGHHEAQWLLVVGEVALQVEESRAGHVSRLVLRPARLDAEAAVAATQEDRRLEDADVVVRQVFGQPVGRNEELGVRECHDQLQCVWACIEVACSRPSIRAPRIARQARE